MTRRTPPKSRRAPELVRVAPAVSAAQSEPDGKVAPSHMGATLGFAPTHARAWRSPGVVRL